METTEDYVSFETAKLLKEKGFNEETEYVYSNNGNLLRLCHFGIRDLTNTDCNNYYTWEFPIENVVSIISAPTLQMACKWLRKNYNLFISIDIGVQAYVWTIYNTEPETIVVYIGVTIGTPEQAYDEAIKYCVENLI